MGEFVIFALTAAFNPTLLAAVTVMLLLDSPKKLLFGYLCGALMTSVTLGLVLVFSASHSSTESTAKHTVNPALDITLALLILILVVVIGTGHDRRRRAWSERRREKARDKAEPRWKRALSGGSARTTFLVGAVLSLPGASYLAGIDVLAKQDLAVPETVVCILGFNVVMLLLLEVPLVGYAIRPAWTAAAVTRFSAALSRDGGRIALIVGVVLAVALLVRGITHIG